MTITPSSAASLTDSPSAAILAELARSQAHLGLALEAGAMGSWEWDIANQRVHWSAQEELLYGLEPGSFSGTVDAYLAQVHPDDLARSWRVVEDAIAKRAETHHILHRVIRPSGDVRWLDSHGRFIYDEQGQAIRLVGISADVTERMRYEGLRDRQDNMLAAVDVGFWYCDLPFSELQWDAKVKEHFWLPLDARVTIETFYERLHADDRERAKEAIDQSIASHMPYDIEYRTVPPDATQGDDRMRWIRAIGYTGYDPLGAPVRFDGITVDITEAKRKTDELARVTSALERGNADLSRAELELRETVERTRFIAEASAALGGSLDTHAVLGCAARISVPYLADRCFAYLADADVDPVGPIAVVMESRQSLFIASVDAEALARGATAPEGRSAVLSLSPRSGLFVPLIARDCVLGALAFLRAGDRRAFTDDERVVAEEVAERAAAALDNARLFAEAEEARAEAEVARRDAETANRAKSEFLARMSHDLRTPLNAIGGYSQLLEMDIHGPVNDSQRQALGRIRRAQEHLLTLINDILSFAKLEAGQVTLSLEAVDVRGVVEELRSLVTPEASARGLTLRVEAPVDDVSARADRARLMQILRLT